MRKRRQISCSRKLSPNRTPEFPIATISPELRSFWSLSPVNSKLRSTGGRGLKGTRVDQGALGSSPARCQRPCAAGTCRIDPVARQPFSRRPHLYSYSANALAPLLGLGGTRFAPDDFLFDAAYASFSGTAGVRCRILRGGRVTIGDQCGENSGTGEEMEVRWAHGNPPTNALEPSY